MLLVPTIHKVVLTQRDIIAAIIKYCKDSNAA